MSNSAKRKARRRKLKAHDAGEDRHNKGLALIKKQARLANEQQSLRQRRDGPSSGPWSSAETALLVRGVMTPDVIDATGRSRAAVVRKVRSLRAAGTTIPNRKPPVTPRDPGPRSRHWTWEEIGLLFVAGVTESDVAAQVHRTEYAVLKKVERFRDAGLIPRIDTSYGEQLMRVLARDYRLTAAESAAMIHSPERNHP